MDTVYILVIVVLAVVAGLLAWKLSIASSAPQVAGGGHSALPKDTNNKGSDNKLDALKAELATAKEELHRKSKQLEEAREEEKKKLRREGKKNEKEETLDICLTHHERLDGNTGMVIVSAALREVQGNPKKHLMIMVPLGVALPAGLQIKIDEDKEPTKLVYTICHPGGCTAEVEASDEIVGKLKKGKQMMVAAMNVAAKPIFLPVPLTGFEPTLSGKPVDPEVYGKARAQLMQQIEQRQIEMLAKAEEDAKKGGGTTTGGAPAATGSTTPPAGGQKK